MKPIAFSAVIDLIGINPFVYLPEAVLQFLFLQAGKTKSPIPVQGTVNASAYRQTLVKYAGAWRLYINLEMLDRATERIGEQLEVTIAFDPEERSIAPHPELKRALQENKEAMQVFASLQPSLQKEIIRYISFLKTEKSIENNIKKAIDFLLGKGRFIGRAGITGKK
ncbi:MAG: DUF1905 domain-containing protein [Sphingobacteriales bacterium]|nr:MAG: DUF1905 domain-containing protein [Sphingobacteriales bacterium]